MSPRMNRSSTTQSNFNIPKGYNFQHGSQDLLDFGTDLDLNQLDSFLRLSAGEAYGLGDDVEMQDFILPVENSVSFDDTFEDMLAMDFSLSLPDLPMARYATFSSAFGNEESLTYSIPDSQICDQFINSSDRQNDLEQTRTHDQQNLNPTLLDCFKPRKTTKKTTRRRFTDAQLRPLKEWLATHTDDPYPSRLEKRSLERDSGLTEAQIDAWFMRARKTFQKRVASNQKENNMGDSPVINPQLSSHITRDLSLRVWFQAVCKRFSNTSLLSEPSAHLHKFNYQGLTRQRSVDGVQEIACLKNHDPKLVRKSRSLDIGFTSSIKNLQILDPGLNVQAQSSRAAVWSLRSSVEVSSNRRSYDPASWPHPPDLTLERFNDLKFSTEKSSSEARMSSWLESLPISYDVGEGHPGCSEANLISAETLQVAPVDPDLTSEQSEWLFKNSQSERCSSDRGDSTRDVASWELDVCASCAISPLHPDFLKGYHRDTCNLVLGRRLTCQALMVHEMLALVEQGHVPRDKTIIYVKNLHNIPHSQGYRDSSPFVSRFCGTVQSTKQDYPKPNYDIAVHSSWPIDIVSHEGVREFDHAYNSERRTAVHDESRAATKTARNSYHQSSPNLEGGRSRAGSTVSSIGSRNSHSSRGSRQGRRVVVSNNRDNAPTEKSPSLQRLYQCTFCSQPLASKYAWRRHEESIHAPQQVWVCGYLRESDDCVIDLEPLECPFCFLQGDSGSVQTCGVHKILQCWQQPAEQRTFFRKDGLIQHIKTSHCCLEAFNCDTDSWLREVEGADYDLRCYFCGKLCENWDRRMDHIGIHFENGATMWEWNKPVTGL